MEYTYIKYNRSESARSLLAKPIANHVLCVIAQRVRYADDPVTGLKSGQCFMGDYATIGITRQQYRTAISNLRKWGFITFSATKAGTTVTLVNSDVYDLNGRSQPSGQPSDNHQPNQQPTISQPSVQPLNKNDKKGKNDKNDKNGKEVVISSQRVTYTADFESFWSAYPKDRRGNKKKAFINWKKIPSEMYALITNHVERRCVESVQWSSPKDRGYIIQAEGFLSGERWEDSWIPVVDYSETTRGNIERIRNMGDLNG